jgi:hypothetical protein
MKTHAIHRLREATAAATPAARHAHHAGRGEAEKPALSLFWSPDGEEFSGAGCEYVPSDHTWVGAKIGVFALSEEEEGGYADLVSVRTEKIG